VGFRSTDRARRHANISQLAREHGANWLRNLGLKLIEVTFYPQGDEPFVEEHVDDLSTLPETVRMTMERKSRVDYAVYPYVGQWCLVSPRKRPEKLLRYYNTKEAAEMVAIHRG